MELTQALADATNLNLDKVKDFFIYFEKS